MWRLAFPLVALLWLAHGPGGAWAQEAPPVSSRPAPASLRLRMLAAEDARDVSSAAIAPLLEGLASADAELRRVAVRALGRMEHAPLGDHIGRRLRDADPSVRAQAADALAQSVFAGATAGQVTAVAGTLRDALASEQHPLARGALAAALGRLPYADDESGHAAGRVVLDVAFPRGPGGAREAASPAVLLGALRGLHSAALAGVRFGQPRRDASGQPVTWIDEEAREALATLLVGRGDDAGSPPAPASVTVRRLAIQALAGRRRSEPAVGLALLDEEDEQVRAIAARWAVELLRDGATRRRAEAEWSRLRGVTAGAAKAVVEDAVARMQGRIASDASAQVRFEAIRAVIDVTPGEVACRWVMPTLGDPDLNVARHALLNGWRACGDAALRARLLALARDETRSATTGPDTPAWHRPAYALVGLAHLEPDEARPHVMAALSAAGSWARRHAALAADAVLSRAGTSRQASDVSLLESVGRLADDADVNVAAQALGVVARHASPGELRAHVLSALRRDEDELLLAALAALPSSASAPGDPGLRPEPDAGLATACADALDRVGAKRRETSRDARLALVACVERAGSSDLVGRLSPLLTDFDPRVAERAAEALATLRSRAGGQQTAAPPVASPRPLSRLPLPTDAEFARMASARVVLAIRGRGEVIVRLRPDEAPLNAFRFLRLAEAGYYTGLTVHRVVPAFVAQGGSPLGNEHSGDGPFTRDEVGRLSNLRASVGLSTRGRDTGDAQFYVNLADNLRLDHTYTVFAQVESGMEVVDGLAEGDVIEKVSVR